MTERTSIPQQRPPKSPALAGILSLIFPGAGSLYLGQFGKAVFYMITLAGLITIQTHSGGQPFKGLMLAAFYIFQFIESINAARSINQAAAGNEAAGIETIRAAEDVVPSGSIFWGITLIILGVLFTMANFEVISYEHLFDFWPMAVIIIGLKMVLDYVRTGNDKKSD